MTEAKKEQKPGYYFKIIPKEEFPKFMERLKEALKKTDNKKGDKKTFEFSLTGSKEDLKGCAFEIFSFDNTRCDEFLDVTQPHIQNGLYCASLNLTVKEEADAEKLKMVFDQFKPMLAGIPYFKDKIEFNFRNKGKQVSFDAVAKDGKLVKAILDLDLDFTEFHKFNFALKSGIDLGEIFDPNADPSANFVKICSIIFSIKSETENVRYLCTALGEALKDVKLNDDEIQKKFDKFVGYLNFINSFIGAKLKLEYDANVLAGEGAKEAEKATGGAEGLKTKIAGTQQAAMGFVQGMLVPMLATFGMIDTAKVLDLDYITISLGVPLKKNGYAISLKLPGITKVLNDILNAPPQQPPAQ
jgi:hypothetical protein